MEEVLLGTAVISFALAFCLLAASGVIFVQGNVADAIRFLRHRAVPLRGKAVPQGAATVRDDRISPSERSAQAAAQPHGPTPASNSSECAPFEQAVTMPIWSVLKERKQNA